jgi:hypothetical protein
MRRLANLEKLQMSPEDEHIRHAYPWVINVHGYFVRYWKEDGKTRAEYLHRHILGMPLNQKSTRGSPGGVVVDHINGNKNDNRRENLRTVTQVENSQNKHRMKGSLSGFRGVRPNGNRWQAFAKLNYEFHSLGTYDTPEEASKVSEEFRRKHYKGLNR